MQPYQEASEEIRRQGQLPIKALKTAASIGTSVASAYAGGATLSRVLPFLSNYIPQNIATKGLEKIDPRFGKFINTALSAGKSFDEIKDFIKDKAQGAEEPKDNRNIIQQYSDQLAAFLENHIKNGRQPLEAGALAQLDPKFQKIINKIEKDHKSPWSSILQSIYGKGDMAQAQGAQSPSPMGTQMQASPPMQTQAQPQGGNADQALLAAMQKILQM